MITTTPVRRVRRTGLIFALLLALSTAVSVGVVSMPADATPIGGKRAAILMPFSGGGSTLGSNTLAGTHNAPFYADSNGNNTTWAEDLHAGEGVAVQARFQTSDGAITLNIVNSGTLNCSPSAGGYVQVKVSVAGTEVGRVVYEHLNNMPSFTSGQTIAVGDTLGTLHMWDSTNNPCWQVSNSGGIHTHVEAQRSCYRSLAASANYNGSTAIGMLSSNYAAATPNTVCDEAEIASVMSTGSTGGSVETKVAVLTTSSGALSAYYRGSNNELETMSQSTAGGPWSGPVALSSNGAIAGSPVAVMNQAGAVSVYVRDASNQLRTYWQAGAGSGTWYTAALPGVMVGDPSVFMTPSGAMAAFFEGTNGDIETSWQSTAGGSWNGPASISAAGAITASPAAVLDQGGIVSVYARGASGELRTYWQSAPGSGTWYNASLGGSITGTPSMFVAPAGNLSAFYRGSNGHVQTSFQSTAGGSWTFADLGDSITGSPTAVLDGSGYVTVFARGTGGDFRTIWQTTPGGGTWASASLANNITGSPTPLLQTNGAYVGFFRGIGGDLQHSWQTSAGSGWVGPVSLGGNIAS